MDIEIGGFKDISFQSRSRSPLFWKTILDGLLRLINSTPESKLKFAQLLLSVTIAKPTLKSRQSVLFLGALIDVVNENQLSDSLCEVDDIDPIKDIVIVVDKGGFVLEYHRIPHSNAKITAKGVDSALRALMLLLPWIGVPPSTIDLKTHLYQRVDRLEQASGQAEEKEKDARKTGNRKKKLAKELFLIHFDEVNDKNAFDFEHENDEEKEIVKRFREDFVAGIMEEGVSDEFRHDQSVLMTIIKHDSSSDEREVYRVKYRIDSLGVSQKRFLLLLGSMRRSNNMTQIVATPLENSSFKTFSTALDCVIELSCMAKIETSLKKAKKENEKKREEGDEVVIFNVASRIALMRDDLSASCIYRGFSFHEKIVFSPKTLKIFATEMSSVCALNTLLSQSACFEAVAPAIESTCVLAIAQHVAGSVSSHYSNRRPHSRLLFLNFNLEECSYLALKYNETSKVVGGRDFHLTNNLFHVNGTHISIHTQTGNDQSPHRIEGSGNKDLNLEELAQPNTNHRVLKIVSIDCTRFSFEVDIKQVMGSESNVSRFVNAQLLFSKGAAAEFRRDKNGNVTMHIPVSTDINHTGRSPEAESTEEIVIEVDEVDEEIVIEEAESAEEIEPDESDQSEESEEPDESDESDEPDDEMASDEMSIDEDNDEEMSIDSDQETVEAIEARRKERNRKKWYVMWIANV
jgi:hypothetical protein